jgi:hypothetical protein
MDAVVGSDGDGAASVGARALSQVVDDVHRLRGYWLVTSTTAGFNQPSAAGS